MVKYGKCFKTSIDKKVYQENKERKSSHLEGSIKKFLRKEAAFKISLEGKTIDGRSQGNPRNRST